MSSSETAANIGETTDLPSIGHIKLSSIDDKLLKNAQMKEPMPAASAADAESSGRVMARRSGICAA